MKRIIFLLILFNTAEAGATHWLTYYIYVETEYVQGPWARTGLLSKSDYRYLAPKVFEDLFGTLKEELAEKLLTRLKEVKPAVYDWEYTLSLHGDTVCLETEGSIDQHETVINEVTATMILNSFKAVCFKYPDHAVTYSLVDLTLPLFDLVSVSETGSDETGKEPTPEPGDRDSRNPLVPWLLLSVLLNLILVPFMVFRLRK